MPGYTLACTLSGRTTIKLVPPARLNAVPLSTFWNSLASRAKLPGEKLTSPIFHNNCQAAACPVPSREPDACACVYMRTLLALSRCFFLSSSIYLSPGHLHAGSRTRTYFSMPFSLPRRAILPQAPRQD